MRVALIRQPRSGCEAVCVSEAKATRQNPTIQPETVQRKIRREQTRKTASFLSPPTHPHKKQLLMWLSPPEPDFASKRSGAQECPAPNGALLSKRSEVASSCWRAAERPLYEKGETKEEEKKKHTNHTQVAAPTTHVNTHQ